ncbi:synaptonemal complex protein 2 isoform X1 [Otolemur garnettii]|uniref:synaptonemal complex protein 2 isoform X1 n=1 Tax=Otolemur garnettii TaxID=30611 RepID=UPI000274053A|nr:synaptonemal complex protein 2 isoform X1 [Otolemur garnettii]XP_023367773.1 synaptonemal complex protein 2 isoform X1 [Otolemur garnettii]
MPIRPDFQQLEKCIDDALRKNDFKPLKTLVQIDACEDVKIKCSKQFFHKLDDLMCRELNKKDIQTVSTILVTIGRCAKNISILGQAGLPTMIKQGLVQKMVSWLEKSKEIILSQENTKDEAVTNMIEDLLDLLMVIHDVSDEGEKQVVETFVPHLCALVIDSRVNICVQQETLKKMNAILDRMPQLARNILSNQEMLILMSSMGERILDVGDYDLQVGIVEALCRMTTEKQRQELACQWFSMDFIANAFKRIKDYEFETDCRIFLNFINGMLGDKRRVFTFPCLSAFLDKHELKIPSDEKLEEFWIDFNLGSQTLSFYIAGDNDDHQWEAVTVSEEKVQLYSIEVRESKKLLIIILKNIIKISKREGKELILYFDASLEITNVTQKIFGTDKYREFTRKQGISVAKTSVHILFDASGSQILVPESQVSPVEELVSFKEKCSSPKEFAKSLKYINSNQGDRKNRQLEITTPSKRKMSEASMIVPGADRYTVRSPILLINTPPPRRGRIKPPLQMMSSAEKPGVSETLENGVDKAASLKSKPSEGRNRGYNTDKHFKTAVVVEKTENKEVEFPDKNFNELQDVVPDSQAEEKRDKPVLPGVLDNICGNKMHSKLACWTPVTNIELCNNRRASTSSGETFNQDVVINKKLTKQKPSSSISDDNSEETRKVKYKKERVDHNKIDKGEVEVYKRNNQQENHPKYSEEKNTKNTKQNDWRIESETTFKSVLLNKTVEESLIYRKKYILSKDMNSAICDKSLSRKNVKSHRKSGKELTSELNSWDLKQKKVRENSKGKGFTDATDTLISKINKRYKPEDDVKSTRILKEALIDSGFSNKPDVQLSTEKVQKKSYRKLKTTFVNVTSECPSNDVYNFNLSGAEEPIIKLGIQEFEATTREACVDNSIKLIGLRSHDELEPSLRTKDKKIITDHKKNLFSDNEAEHRCDDNKTDISWLREPKSKPQLIDYSRNKNVKKHTSGKLRSSLEKRQPRSKMTSDKSITKKVDKTVPDERTKLPRRAAKTKKNYKDLSNSESESEQEFSHSVKKKLLVKEENIHSKTKTISLPKKKWKVLGNTQKELPKEWKNSSLLKDTTRDNCLDLSPLSGTPSSIEVMRCVEKITEGDFSQDYCATRSISPYPKISSSESLSSNSGVGHPIKSPQNNDNNLLHASGSCSPTSQPLFLPRHTPTKNNSVVKRKNINSVVLAQETQNCNSYSDISSHSLEKRFLEIESPNFSENHIQRKREGSRSASLLSMCNEDKENTWFDMPYNTTHVSGLTHHLSRKRMYIEDNLNNSDEVEIEEKEERRAKFVFPKKYKSEDTDHHVHKTSESISPLSNNEFSIHGENWDGEFSGAGMICEKFNSEFRKRIHIRHNIMDQFTKQSCKTAKQHLNSVKHQVKNVRFKRLDKFQFTMTEQLDSFEKESQSLNDFQQEFVDCWERTFYMMKACQKSELQRLHLLKAALDKHVFYDTDCEETIFTSEMCLMKENMKILQDKLLKDMQEEELLNVRRGLMSLFITHERNDNM